MISKKISDLKDINFEISTALQFEPSHSLTSPWPQFEVLGEEDTFCLILNSQNSGR